MPLIPPRKVWVGAGVAKSRKSNRLEIVRAITHPFEREKRAVSESIAGRKRLLLAHAVPQRTGLSNSIFRLCKFRRRWRSRPLLIGSVDALPSTSRTGAATIVSSSSACPLRDPKRWSLARRQTLGSPPVCFFPPRESAEPSVSRQVHRRPEARLPGR